MSQKILEDRLQKAIEQGQQFKLKGLEFRTKLIECEKNKKKLESKLQESIKKGQQFRTKGLEFRTQLIECKKDQQIFQNKINNLEKDIKILREQQQTHRLNLTPPAVVGGPPPPPPPPPPPSKQPPKPPVVVGGPPPPPPPPPQPPIQDKPNIGALFGEGVGYGETGCKDGDCSKCNKFGIRFCKNSKMKPITIPKQKPKPKYNDGDLEGALQNRFNKLNPDLLNPDQDDDDDDWNKDDDDDDDWNKKYLKYKIKYLNLKKKLKV